MSKYPKPDWMDDSHLTYLDDLRASGVTNMYGAAPYLQREFGLQKKDAKAGLLHWMETFDQRHGAGRTDPEYSAPQAEAIEALTPKDVVEEAGEAMVEHAIEQATTEVEAKPKRQRPVNADDEAVFALRLPMADRERIKRAAKAAGFGRGNGGVAAWALKTLLDAAGKQEG